VFGTDGRGRHDASSQWRNKGGRAGHWPRAPTKKLKKLHTKGRKKIFLKGRHFLRGAKILI